MTKPSTHRRSKPAHRSRPNCIACGSTRLEEVWSGAFLDEPTRSYLEGFHYAQFEVDDLADERFDLVRCEACSQRFHRRILDDEWMRVLYSEWIDSAQIDHFERQHSDRDRARQCFEIGRQRTKHVLRLQVMLKRVAQGRVRLLDYGCGDGGFLGVALSFGFDAFGIDFSTSRDSRAAARGLQILPNLEALDEVADQRLHAVTMFEVLEHLPEPMAALEGIARRMAPGGILIVEVPDCSGIIVPGNTEEFHAVQPLEHINTFTPDSLRAFCGRAGFVEVHKIPAHVSARLTHLARTEATRFVRRRGTALYFKLTR